MPVFLIKTISSHKMQYAVEADTFEQAFKTVREGIDDFHQEHLGEALLDVEVVSDEDLVYKIRMTEPYYGSWSDEQILETFKYVN